MTTQDDAVWVYPNENFHLLRVKSNISGSIRESYSATLEMQVLLELSSYGYSAKDGSTNIGSTYFGAKRQASFAMLVLARFVKWFQNGLKSSWCFWRLEKCRWRKVDAVML